MYSQRDEEKHIIQYFRGKKNARFLDIGAYDGHTFSNTRRLAECGWGGVLVEPCPTVQHSLISHYGENSKFQIIEKGIGVEAGVSTFYNFCGDAVGTFNLDHAILWEEKGKRKWEEMQIEVITPAMLFSMIGYDFDFLNLDIEGWTLEVLEEIPFDKLTKLSMACIEYDFHLQRVLSLVQDYGFALSHKTAENVLVTRKIE